MDGGVTYGEYVAEIGVLSARMGAASGEGKAEAAAKMLRFLSACYEDHGGPLTPEELQPQIDLLEAAPEDRPAWFQEAVKIAWYS